MAEDIDDLVKLLLLRKLLEDKVNTDLLGVGLRVVRGPNWEWGNQDGGEGNVGTVVQIDASDSKVTVRWDCGTCKTYRTGKFGFFDLRTLDNAPIGIKHPTVTCNSCRKEAILGIRWKCKVCYDYDLCNQCYMSDKHDVSHPFYRYLTYEASSKVEVPKRQGAVKIQMKGIFASAKVVRGADWDWQDQDGGTGSTGIVTQVCGWNDDTDGNAARVYWSSSDKTNLYRLGHCGKIDLKYVEAAAEGYYYRDHLPILGDEKRTVKEEDFKEDCVDASAKESTNRTGLSILSQNMQDLFCSDQYSDLTVKIKGHTYKVHKAVISSRSPVLASKLHAGISVLEISDCEPDTFEEILFYMYTGRLKQMFSSALYDAAVKFDIQSLKDEYILFKKEGLSDNYVSHFLAAA